jgi:predicted enzyme related to lactoylglutathione lyase
MNDRQLSSRDILIQTEDIDTACSFYEQQFGLTSFMRQPDLIGLEAGAFRLFLERAQAYGPVFEFFVDNLEDAKARLVASGCRVEAEDPSIPKCYIRDPFGLTFNIAIPRI